MHSRRPALFAAAALAAFFLPQLWGRQVYSRVTWRLLVPCRAFLGAEFRAGEFPGWYPYEAYGTPFHAQAVCGVLHPLSWLSALLRPESVLSLQTLCAVALAGLGAWFFARVLGAAPFGCAIAAVSYALSGYLVAATDNIVFLWSAAHLPIQLAAFALAGLRGWSRGLLAVAVLATVSSALMGDVQGAPVFAAAAVLTGLLLAPSGRARYLTGSGVAAVLTFGLCAPQLLPAFAFLRETSRGGEGLSFAEATYWSLHPLRLPELVLPFFSPIGAAGRAEHLFGSVPGRLLWGEALGGSALVSALALAALATRRVNGRARLALSVLFGLGLLLSLGRHTPFFRLVRAAVPPMRSLRFPEKFVPLVLVALAALAALGWTAAGVSWRRRGVVASIAAFLLCATAWLAAGSAQPVAGGYLRDLSRSLALSGAVLALGAGMVGRRGWALGALVLVAAETGSGSWRAWDTRPLADSTSPPETLAALREAGVRPGAGRVTSVGYPGYPLDESQLLTARERAWMDFERKGVGGSMGGWLGVESALAYLAPSRAYIEVQSRPPAELLATLAPRFNVVAAFAPAAFIASTPGLAAPVATFPGDLNLVRLPVPWPRAYLAGAVPQVSDRSSLAQVEDLGRGQALVSGWSGGAEPAAEGTASIAEYGPQRVRVEVQAARESFLVLNDQGSSGWSAMVSGHPAPIQTANVLVRAVRVPAGASTVVFRYSVPGLREGTLVFAVSAALLLALLGARPPWRWLSPGQG